MKKSFIIFILFSCILASLLFAPKILKFSNFQEQVSEKITHSVGVPTEMGKLSWHWFPFPYLLVQDIKLSTEGIVIDIPELRLLPDWEAIFHGKITLSKIKLINPMLTIQSFQTDPSLSPQLSGIKIIIKNGAIATPASEFSHQLIVKKTRLSEIYGNLTFNGNRFKFNLTGRSNFCKKFSSTGRIDFRKSYYRIDTQVTDFNFADIIKSYGAIIQPISKKISMSLFTEGMTKENFKISLTGDVPPLNLKGVDWFPIQTKQCEKISLEKYGRDFFLKIDDLQFTSPAFHLNGSISRRVFDGHNDPIWDLDLSARDIDLSQSRNFVLKEWGNNIVAKEVCSIVLGGKANSAKYLFQGSLHDFETIEKMKILVDVDNAAIFIPHIKLPLDTTTGKIAIIDGKLTGNNLSATIGTSRGSHGDLLLDLRHGKHGFKLDLDLDVDGKKLPKILRRIVTNRAFHNELAHFTSIEGRAAGHLSLGDSLRDIKTTIKVDSLKMTGIYDRLPWPLNLESGKIKIEPQKVTWSDINATLDPHIIKRSSGFIDWHKTPYLNITYLDADLETNDLLNHGSLQTNSTRYNLRPYVSKNLLDMGGRISIDRFNLNGPASTPAEWQYSFACTTNALSFSSPLLPESVHSTLLFGQINNKRINLQTDFKLLGDDLTILADYSHTFFSQWSGTSTLNGQINDPMMNWLNDRIHIPKSLHLRPPVTLEPMKLTTSTSHPDQYRLAGRLTTRNTNRDLQCLTPFGKKRRDKYLINSSLKKQVSADFEKTICKVLKLNIDHRENSLKAMVTFVSSEKPGSLTYSVTGEHISHPSQNSSKKRWRSQSSPIGQDRASFLIDTGTEQEHLITWQGALDMSTADLFLAQQPFIGGAINGAFTLTYNGEFNDMSFRGKLAARNIVIEKDQTTTYPTISELDVSGLDKSLMIDQAQIILEDNSTLLLSGEITPGNDSIYGNMKLTADKLSSQNLRNIMKKFSARNRDKTPLNSSEANGKRAISLTDKINGRLEFAINKFLFLKKRPNTPDNPLSNQDQVTRKIIFTPLNGLIKQQGSDNREITLTKSNLCGILISGGWQWDDNGTESGKVTLTNSGSQNFQTTLPCLGVNKSIIEGDVDLKAELNGYPDNWQDGKITIRSSCGIIRRMDLLSKIFSLINFTEIFAFEDLPNIDRNGLQYNDLLITGNIKNNIFHIEKATLKGKGLNLSGQGTINLKKSTCNLTLFIAPFKMVDSVVTSIPLVGKIVGGKKGAILTFPVKVEGKLDNPTITPISPTAIGKATFDFIKETLSLPFTLFSPLLPDNAVKKRELAEPTPSPIEGQQ